MPVGLWFWSEDYYHSFHVARVQGVASSMDSDLEAFSHNPADDSFAALAFQPTAKTKYLNQGFLSY